MLSRGGGRIPIIPATTFVRGQGDKPGAIVVTLRGISELRSLEKSVGQLHVLLDVTPRVHARQALAESERKYRELVENSNSIIMRITPDHDITFFNEFAQQFFGCSEGEVLGKNVVGTIVPETGSTGRDMRKMTRNITAQPEVYD